MLSINSVLRWPYLKTEILYDRSLRRYLGDFFFSEKFEIGEHSESLWFTNFSLNLVRDSHWIKLEMNMYETDKRINPLEAANISVIVPLNYSSKNEEVYDKINRVSDDNTAWFIEIYSLSDKQ